jgi:chemotaxis protein CheD
MRSSNDAAQTPAPADHKARLVTVLQGEFACGSEPDLILSTVLGSCVCVCLHDPIMKLGGMNHFLLPEDQGSNIKDLIFGAHSMEMLINDLLRRGASRTSLEAKMFGGARMISGLSDIGARNANFARQFLSNEGFRILADDTGGARGRRLRYWPENGRVQMRYMIATHLDTTRPAKAAARASDDVELF